MVRTTDDVLELAIMIGLQASGKTTFCRQVLAATHVVVSKDAFPNSKHRQRRQLQLIGEALAAGRDVVVDNTNPSPQEWQPLIDIGRGGTAHASSGTGSHPTWRSRPSVTRPASIEPGYPMSGCMPRSSGCGDRSRATDSTGCASYAPTDSPWNPCTERTTDAR
jgi:AAA domain